jgi:hypothetical protein
MIKNYASTQLAVGPVDQGDVPNSLKIGPREVGDPRTGPVEHEHVPHVVDGQCVRSLAQTQQSGIDHLFAKKIDKNFKFFEFF